ncbi:MAG TPA: ABC transporter permease [Blastocatellia bacterium]|nr:ABC transporter permease [Blastocatellia bacterium]
MQTLWQDLRYGVRTLMKRPGFTLIAIITLALGIGANTVIFSVVQATLLKPLPYIEPERLAIIRQDLPKLNWSYFNVTPLEFLDYQAGNEVFSDIAGFKSAEMNLTGRGEAQSVLAARVSASLFNTLGIAPMLGRTFAPGEDTAGREQVTVLSHRLWQTQFNGEAAAIGQVIKLDERPYTVIGVMPPRVRFPHAGTTFVEATELWVPLVFTEQETANRRSGSNVGVIGRLKPGASFEHAQAGITAIATRFQREHPDVYQGDIQVVATLHSLERQVTRRARPLVFILFGAVSVVLLIACANVAHLLLARSAQKRKEMAVRRALGAGSWRLVRQVMTECILLALCGGGGGLLLAAWAIRLLVRFGPDDAPRLQEAGIDAVVLGFTLLVSLLTGLLSGLAPVIESARFNLNEALRELSRAGDGLRSLRLRGGLVIIEVAAALVLLAGAGLLINSFVRLLRTAPGFDPQGVLVGHTNLSAARYPRPEQTQAVNQQALEKLSALPGVDAVAAASNIPLTGEWLMALRVEGGDEERIISANFTLVSPDYFRAMGIQLRAGRVFTEHDRQTVPGPAVINETFARLAWPGVNTVESAIGKRVAPGRRGENRLAVAGVVADVKISALDAEAPPMIYIPMSQVPRIGPNVAYILRTTGDPESFARLLRREINAVDRDLPVNIQTLQQTLGDSLAQRRFIMLALSALATVALLLAAIGLYGVMSYAVTERTREIGVRMALGARVSDVLRLVMRQGMGLVSIGMALGSMTALALTQLMKSLLFGVSAADPLTFATIALLLTVVALLACYIPARRATKVDPIVALRDE